MGTGSNFVEYGAEWAPFPPAWSNDPADALRVGAAMMGELMPGIARATQALGLPPGATIEIELSFRARQAISV